MQAFIRYLLNEQPRINALLDQEGARLSPVVQPVVTHVLKAGGKRVRPLLTLLTSRALGFHDDSAYPLACSVELLHSATLLHDDILDDADLRRGLQASHKVFGVTPTVLAGDVLLALANQIIAGYKDPRMTALASQAIMETAIGEIDEIAQVDNLLIDYDRYLGIITGKTAFMIQASCGIGALLAKADDELIQSALDYGLNLGIAFQLVDDALDYDSTQENTGKPVGGDLREGKVTLPLILFFQDLAPEERESLASSLGNPSLDQETLDILIRRVQEGGYGRKAREHAEHFAGKALDALKRFPSTQETGHLRTAVHYILTRDH